MIISINEIKKEDDSVSVIALLEDSFTSYHGSYYDPPEYSSGYCESSFYLDENELLPVNEKELIDYLNNLNLDWRLLPKDWYD